MSDQPTAQPHPEFTDRSALRELVRSMIGRPVWSPRLGIGSFLTVEVGAPAPPRPAQKPGVAAPQHGEYHVWLYCSAWRLDHGTQLICGSEDDRDDIARALPRLEGRTVAHADVSEALELTIGLDDGTALRAFPIFSAGYEHWMVFAPNGYVYTAGPGSIWTAAPQNA